VSTSLVPREAASPFASKPSKEHSSTLAYHGDNRRPTLAEHIRIWRPKAIVVVMIAIEQNVARAAREAGQDSIPRYALPFPGRRAHRDRYVTELTALLKMFVEEGVFLVGAK
jgi:hypothetical protein